MIYELVLWNFDCSLEFVFSLLLLQPFNFSPVSFACNFQDWGCVILREIDFLLKICWSIPCLHPSWKVNTWIEICATLNHRKKTKADGSRLIPRKHTETLVLLSVVTFTLPHAFTCLGYKSHILVSGAHFRLDWSEHELSECCAQPISTRFVYWCLLFCRDYDTSVCS